MAMSLLDFTSGNVDLNVTPSGGAAISIKCILSDVSFRLNRTMQNRRTLCSGIWNQRAPTDQIATITATRQTSKGATYSDPINFFMGSTNPCVITFTADTSCTITGNWHCTDDGLGGVAGGVVFAGGLAFENYGPITAMWVTT